MSAWLIYRENILSITTAYLSVPFTSASLPVLSFEKRTSKVRAPHKSNYFIVKSIIITLNSAYFSMSSSSLKDEHLTHSYHGHIM